MDAQLGPDDAPLTEENREDLLLDFEQETINDLAGSSIEHVVGIVCFACFVCFALLALLGLLALLALPALLALLACVCVCCVCA